MLCSNPNQYTPQTPYQCQLERIKGTCTDTESPICSVCVAKLQNNGFVSLTPKNN